MSFVKKAAKKVFKGIKKVVKKVWKPVLIGAAIFFTAGLAAPAFVGFGASMAAAGGGIGGFMSAVGATMAAGGAAMAGTIGLGSAPGLFSGAAAAGTATTGGMTLSGMLSGQAAMNAAGTALGSQALLASGAGAALGAAGFGQTAANIGAQSGGGGFFSALGNVLKGLGGGGTAPEGEGGGLFSGPIGKMMLFNGISQGIQGYAASKEADRERKRYDQGFFFGGPRRGGDSDFEGVPEVIRYNPPQNAGQQVMAQQQDAFAQGNTSPNLFQTQQPQQLQGQIQPMAPIMQPGNLDLIGPDPQDPQNFGVA